MRREGKKKGRANNKRVTFSSVNGLAIWIMISSSTCSILGVSHTLIACEMHGVTTGGDMDTRTSVTVEEKIRDGM